MPSILTAIYLTGVPLLVILLARRWRWIDKISPMTVLYVIGLLAANLLPDGGATLCVDPSIVTLFGNIAIPLALPLMLMGCNTNGWNFGKAAKVFLSGLLAVLIATVAGFLIFRPEDPDAYNSFAQVCAVATGIYTGGIPNMGAIKQAVAMPHETYLYITSYDLIVTGLYLVFIILAGRPVFRALLPATNHGTGNASSTTISKKVNAGRKSNGTTDSDNAINPDNTSNATDSESPSSTANCRNSDTLRSNSEIGNASNTADSSNASNTADSSNTCNAVDSSNTRNATDSESPSPRKRLSKPTLAAIGLTLLIAAASYLLSMLPSADGSPNMTILILLLTTLSIAATLIPSIKRQQQSFDIGLYLVYVFCLSIASACDVRKMDITGSLPILYYLGFIIIASLAIQIILARILKIDGDSVMVCSVALINSPPFVPLAAALLNNKQVILLGISIGILGYMLGNYLGIGLYHLLLSLHP